MTQDQLTAVRIRIDAAMEMLDQCRQNSSKLLEQQAVIMSSLPIISATLREVETHLQLAITTLDQIDQEPLRQPEKSTTG